MQRTFITILFLLCSYTSTASEVIFPFKATYTVKWGGITMGTMTRELKRNGEREYTLETLFTTAGVAAWFKSDSAYERSSWVVDGGRLLPQGYHFQFDNSDQRVRESLRFDYTTGRYEARYDDKLVTLPIPPGGVDKLLYQVALRGELAKGVKQISLQVINKGKLDTVEAQVVGEEQVTTPLGKYRSVKVKRGTTTIWSAPDLGYLPVQLEKEEGGLTAAIYLISLERY